VMRRIIYLNFALSDKRKFLPQGQISKA